MCYYPKFIRNPKYKENKKNGGKIPPVTDPRVMLVPVGCGECEECRKKKARDWQVRLLEDIKENTNGKFITLTFSDESIHKIIKQCKLENITGYHLDNAIATNATRLFLERWRKKYKKSLRHWLVTELGHHGTENVHMHGIVWTDQSYEAIRKEWQYGFIWPTQDSEKNTFVSAKTINYIIKYVSKMDADHPNYKSLTLTSPGIGSNYKKILTHTNKYNENGETNEAYRTENGKKISMPIYWRNMAYDEKEREKLWIEKLDKGIRWIGGIKIDANNHEEIINTLKYKREQSKLLGYGTGTKDWNAVKYENELRELKYAEREQRRRTNANNSNNTNDRNGNTMD